MKINSFLHSQKLLWLSAFVLSAPILTLAQIENHPSKTKTQQNSSETPYIKAIKTVQQSPSKPIRKSPSTLSKNITIKDASSDCMYWNTLVDPKAPKVSAKTVERDSKDILKGIGCLLQLEGRTELGVRYGQKPFVSQTVPNASVEINALYEILELFFGNDDFAYAIALTEDPPKLVGEYDIEEFNSPEAVSTAFASYRKWFETVQKIGLEEARQKKLHPLINSGVKWY